VLRPAQGHAADARQAMNAGDAHAQAGLLGQVVGEAGRRPQRERQAQSSRATTHELEQALAVLGRDLRGCTGARRIAEPGQALGLVPREPAPHRLLVLTHDGRDLAGDHVAFGRQ